MFSTSRRTEFTPHEGAEAFSIDTFYPKSNFTTFGLDGPSVGADNSFANTSLEHAARTFLVSSGITEAASNFTNLHFDSGFTRGDLGYAYFSQLRTNGTLGVVPIDNVRVNVAFKGDRVIAYGTSYTREISKTYDTLIPDSDAKKHVKALEEKLGANTTNSSTLDPRILLTISNATYTESRAVYLVEPVENAETGSRYSAYIDGATGTLVGVTDYVSHLPFMAVPATKKSLDEGIETFPSTSALADTFSSPIGWTSYDAFHSSSATAGNNVAVMVNGTSVEDKALEFNWAYDLSKPLDDPINQKAAAANVFYLMNMMHDVTYRYGFTENVFNFQRGNFKEGAALGDSDELVVFLNDTRAHADGPRLMTPPDGESPQCYIPAGGPASANASAGRDAAMDNTVLIHEYAHGVTNRLVGGGNARCLQTFEATGLGEGFSDAMADWMAEDADVTNDFVVGAYFSNSTSGLRSYPYSTNSTINPLEYSDIGNSSITTKENDIGEVWANILHNVYAVLAEEFHLNPNKLRAPDATEGNVVFMRIFMDALSLLPCNPTVLQARDAWIQADMTRYGGIHVCTMYKAFASRGLGVAADEASYIGDDKIPDHSSDHGDVIYYTGEGGHSRSSELQIKDQEWVRGNAALKYSVQTRKPVRVIRSHVLRSKYAPASGYRYDGLYRVTDAVQEVGKNGHAVCRFELKRIPGQAPIPGSSGARASSSRATSLEEEEAPVAGPSANKPVPTRKRVSRKKAEPEPEIRFKFEGSNSPPRSVQRELDFFSTEGFRRPLPGFL